VCSPMRIARSPRPALAVLVALAALAAMLAGCGKSTPLRTSGGAGSGAGTGVAPASSGAIGVATKNTTRLGGPDPVADAAAVARTAYPGLTPATRPQAVVLVDDRDWPAALAASALAGAPLGAPILYSEGDTLPAATLQALLALHPVGAPALGGAQVVRIGTSASVPDGYRTRSLPVGKPAAAAGAATAAVATVAAIEPLFALAHGGAAPRQVIVLAAGAPPALAMPAAGLAAESGVPILLVTATAVPAATATVLARLHRPAIYIVDPAAVSGRGLAALARFGPVTPIAGGSHAGEAASPVDNAIAVSRFTDGVFGWGVKEPGHGLVFASASRPLDAPASALLSASGDYGPLLLLESPSAAPAVLTQSLTQYLSDIQPAYTAAPASRPVRGVYNHGWLIGDERAISAVTQAEIDAMLEIAPRRPTSEEPAVSPVE
jgi:ell wall binding domain 2 (CWB2)